MQYFNLPEEVKTDIFTPLYGYGVNMVHTWTKPSWARSIFIVCISGGGGGGGGCSGAANTQRGGGSGGGGGTIARAFLPSSFCPTNLFIKIGRGGAGGIADAFGDTGDDSSVGLWVDNEGNLTGYAMLTTTHTSAGGKPGTTTAGGTSSSFSGSITPYYRCFNMVSTGKGSGAGGATGGGNAGTQAPFGPGAGHGGAGSAAVYVSSSGGGSAGFSTLYGTATFGGAGAATGGSPGQDGPTVWIPSEYIFSSSGAAGGGNANTGTGGAGGAGGLGAGGGGGGAGFTGGAGGAGGDGAVIIACW